MKKLSSTAVMMGMCMQACCMCMISCAKASDVLSVLKVNLYAA